MGISGRKLKLKVSDAPDMRPLVPATAKTLETSLRFQPFPAHPAIPLPARKANGG